MLIKNPAKPTGDGYLDRTPKFQYILLSLLFPMWGAAAGLNDILIQQFKDAFSISNAVAAFVQSAFYGGYFLIAIPASRVIRRTSYKVGVLCGLLVYIIGCALFFPATKIGTYSIFLVAIFAIAIGLSFLETSANTFSSMLGPRASSTLRLNISQTFTPVGNLTGSILGKYLVYGTTGAALTDQLKHTTGSAHKHVADQLLNKTLTPYMYILVVLIILFILFIITEYPTGRPDPKYKGEEAHKEATSIGDTLRYLSHIPDYWKGILAQFMYVGLQTAMWSFTVRLATDQHPHMSSFTAANFSILGFGCFLLGKIPANFLMRRYSPPRVLMWYMGLGALMCLIISFGPGASAVYLVPITSLLMGPGWPTIFGRTLDTIEDKRFQETGGAILAMAIAAA